MFCRTLFIDLLANAHWEICSRGRNSPGAPAKSTLKRPIDFPLSVNGRRLGILMLGMMSWEAPPGPRRGDALDLSSSSPDIRCWLLISSVMEMSSSGRRDWLEIDLGLLGSEEGSSGFSGVSGRETVSEGGGRDDESCTPYPKGLIVDRRREL